MRLRIHRGTKEIGGTCIEVEAQSKRLALDVGLPLDAPDDEGTRESLLPAVSGFREHDDSLSGVLVSHPHQDHYGLAKYIRPDVPVYIGEAAHNILTAASHYVPNGHAFTDPRFIAHRKPLEIGPFRVTPYLVDQVRSTPTPCWSRSTASGCSTLVAFGDTGARQSCSRR